MKHLLLLCALLLPTYCYSQYRSTCHTYRTSDGGSTVTECDSSGGWHSYIQCDTHGNCSSGTYQQNSGVKYREEPMDAGIKAAKQRSDERERQAITELCSGKEWRLIGFDRCLILVPVTSSFLTPILSAQYLVELQPPNLPRRLPKGTRR